MPKLISPDPPSFNPSSISSFSTSNSSKRPISIKKKSEIGFVSLDKKRTSIDSYDKNYNAYNESLIKPKKKTSFKDTTVEIDNFYSSLSSESYSDLSSSLNLDMSTSSTTSSSMYSSFHDKSIDSYEYNRHLKMADRKFVGVLPRLNDSLSRKSTSKLESINEISHNKKKSGWKIKEKKYKKSKKKYDNAFERGQPILIENLKNLSYTSSNSPISSTSSSSSILSLSDATTHRPISNNFRSVALSYYHHLYEQKQKSINSNNSQPLYKFTYNKNNSSSRGSKLSNYESINYDTGNSFSSHQNEQLMTSLLSKRRIKENPILNDHSLIRLEKNQPDTFSSGKSRLKNSRLTKSTNNIDNDDLADLKIISKLSRNEFLEDKLNVKTFYKNVSPSKRKHFSDPHNVLIRETLDKLDDTKKKEWSSNHHANQRSNLAQTSQLEINVCNVNKSQLKDISPNSEKPSFLNKPLQLSINAKKNLCGLLTADIKLNDQAINFDLNKIDETKYEIKLLPTKTGTYQVHVYLNGQSVNGSPFLIRIDGKEDANNNSNGLTSNNYNNIKSLRGKETLSLIDMNKFDLVSPPPITFKLLVRAELIEDEINLTVGKEIKLNIIAIDAVKKEKLVASTIGIQSKVIYNNYEIIRHSLDTDVDGNFQLKFLPTKEGLYVIRFYKDGKFIEGSALELIIKEPTNLIEKREMFTQVGVPFVMTVDHKNVDNLKVRVNMKQNDNTFLTSSSSALSVSSQSTQFSHLLMFMSSLRVEKFIESNNRLRIKFIPIEPVEHSIDIIENGQSIPNFPVKLNVYPNKDILLINDNINGVKLGAPAKVTLQLASEQKSSLNIRITHLEENAPHYVSFLLTEEYNEIQHIFAALCKFLRLSSSRLKDGECTNENGQTRVKFLLVDDVDSNSNIYLLKELKTIIDNDKYVIIDLSIHKTIKAVKDSLRFGPRNENVRFKLEKKSSEIYALEFKPSLVGKYRVDIENYNKPILNSPCFIDAYDPNQVVIDKISDSFIIGTENFIDVDLSKAGSSKFKVWVETPSGPNFPVVFDSNYRKKIGIIPKEVGTYLVFMKLGDTLIKGVPLEINAVKPNFPVAHGHGLYRAIENQKATFNIVAPDNFDSDLNIKIKSPSNKYIGFTITKLSENDYQVTYFPHECGKFIISIIWSDKNIPESIYEVCVFNPAKVKALNLNNETIKSHQIVNLNKNEENCIVFDTKQAGIGNLTVEVMSSNYERLPFSRMVKDKMHKIVFVPPTDGEYKINAFWNHLPVMQTPLVARTLDYNLLLNDIKIVGDGAAKPKLGEQSEFIIDCTKLNLNIQPEVSIVSASDEQEIIDVGINQISSNIYKCSYILDRPDDYLMSVKMNDLHVCNSPYEFNVRVETDPSKVKFNKEDIKLGIIGQEIKTLIDTSQAGAGELTASCLGPNKAAICKFEDKKNGIYLLTITPQETGKHILQIKYNDEHIPDSPFSIRISNQPDASKVKVFGPGIFHGVLSDFKSKFSCDTKGAGAGQLTVRIKGPKGAFKVEMQRESERDRKITCKYDPIEAGDYQINVKWSGKHVPNSPFNVKIFKKHEDLENYLKENPNELKHDYIFHDATTNSIASNTIQNE